MEVSLFYNMASHLRSQTLSQMTICAQHVRPHVHLKNNLNLCYCGGKPRSCDSSIVLWSLFCVSSMYGFKKKTMSFPLRTCPALAASKSQFFSSPASAQRLAPSSPHGKLPNSDLTKTSGWARPNWCCAAAAALFSSYLFIFLREFHQKLGDRWIFDLMRDIRERTTQQRQGDVFLSPNSLNWKVDMHPSFTVVFPFQCEGWILHQMIHICKWPW